eukprot:TRINITY_DN5819_c0_g1_i1.p1 TRINITY_DN5819_c0_g1~~TRINITY_DN5819_c0_g1_i1.p1  ORF type:complete len:572 (-),score=176.27 TRINITY_DN5819_c0_g1_i1:100-1815(-)
MTSKLNELFGEFWEWRLRQSPEYASLVGESKYNGVLEEFTPERFHKDFERCQDFLRRARELSSNTESNEDRVNLEIFMNQLETFITGYEFSGFYYPVCYLEGPQVDFVRLAEEWARPTSRADFVDVIRRYEGFGAYVDQVIGMLRLAVKEGKVYHKVSMEGVLAQIERHTSPSSPEDTVFWNPFKSLPVDSQDLIPQAKAAIQDSIQSGFKKLHAYLRDEYLNHTRPEIGCTTLPNGERHYAVLLKFHTSTNYTAQEIHDIGHREVQKIENEMKEIIKETGHGSMGLKEFADMLRKDPKFFANSSEELMSIFKETMTQKINPKLSQLFWKTPKTKLEIVESPEPNSPAAFYIQGTKDGKRPGKFYVNTHQYKSQPIYESISLSLHEGNPGHHLQSSYLLEQPSLPDFRGAMEDRIYTQAPSRFPIDTAYVEGWALYCEELGLDLKLYDNPYDRYGHLSEAAFRACRLVVDTGMHALGWTQERAIQYMLDHTAASLENIQGETKRYITWPGQATGYKIGQLKIRSLREKAETELGNKFDIRDFHEVLLLSAGPLEIVEAEVNRYIQNGLNRN